MKKYIVNILHSARRWHKSLESYVIRKAIMRSSEGGRWKSTHQGNSLAAYPTSCVVRREAVGKVPIVATRWRPTLLHVRFDERGVETGLWQGYLGTAKRKGRQQTNRTYCYRATFRLYRKHQFDIHRGGRCPCEEFRKLSLCAVAKNRTFADSYITKLHDRSDASAMARISKTSFDQARGSNAYKNKEIFEATHTISERL
jgi:hypothetical protein